MSDQREALYQAFLKEAGRLGWNQAALERACQTCNITPIQAEMLFPKGLDELAQYHDEMIDQALKTGLPEAALSKMRVRDRIGALIMARIECMTPDKAAMKALAAYHLHPCRCIHATGALWNVADMMWYLAGDRSSDINYYTKRTLLAGVYGSTLAFWLHSNSIDAINTKGFMERRLQNVMSIQTLKEKINQYACCTTHG